MGNSGRGESVINSKTAAFYCRKTGFTANGRVFSVENSEFTQVSTILQLDNLLSLSKTIPLSFVMRVPEIRDLI